MYIFLDESGDLGFGNKSSLYFVITILVCDNRQTVASFNSAVKHTLIRKLNYKSNRNSELKGYSTLFKVKKYFLNNLLKKNNQDWFLYSLILDRGKLIKKVTESPKINRLYNVMTQKILSEINFSETSCDIIRLIVDRCKSRRERQVFNYYLQSNLEAHLPIDSKMYIMHEVSNNEAGLQAADMFCYGIVRKYSHQDTKWYDLFKTKIKSEEIYA